jgi:hypothetical protein
LWQKGAADEEAAGKTFDSLAAEGFVVLQDRRKPASGGGQTPFGWSGQVVGSAV